MKKFFLLLCVATQLFLVSCRKQEAQSQGKPLDYVFYLSPKNTSIDPETLFFSYTHAFDESFDEGGSTWDSKKMPAHLQSMGLFSQLGSNPKVSLNELYQGREKLSQIRENGVPLGVFIHNKDQEILDVLLPPALPTSLYMAGHHILLKNDINVAKDIVVGVNISKIPLYVDMRFDYQKNIVPTKISVEKNVSALSFLLVQSDLDLNGGGLSLNEQSSSKGLMISKTLELYNSRVFAKNIVTDPTKRILFYGEVTLEFQEKSSIKNILNLEPEDQCFASEISPSPNKSIVKIKNVDFQPRLIVYKMNPFKNKGYFYIEGDADLTHTILKIVVTCKKISEEFLNKKIPIISSTHAIQGNPTLEVDFIYDEIKNHYIVNVEKDKNNTYIVVSKKTK